MIVFSPVVTAAARTGDSEYLANAIGFYLESAVAGAPELGQSPLRDSVARVAKEHHHSHLRLPRRDAVEVAHAIGATHAAVGEFAETPAGITLTYSIYRDSSGTAQGAPIVVKTRDRVALLKQLPGLAQSLRAALGASHSVVTPPPLASITPDMMTRLGACTDNEEPADDLWHYVEAVGASLPLFAERAILFADVWSFPDKARQYAGLLLNTLPRNTQAIGNVGRATPRSAIERSQGPFALSDAFPNCYALAHACTWIARARDYTPRQSEFGARAAKDAPANADAHLTYAMCIALHTEQIRQGRVAKDVDENTWDTLRPLYAKALQEDMAATICDPRYGKTWARLAQAATFAGADDIADQAMTVARRMNADDAFDTYSWALEMYQPKWLDNPSRLLQVANEASRAHYTSENEQIDILLRLNKLGFASQTAYLEKRLQTEATKRLAHDRHDEGAQYLQNKIYDMHHQSPGKSSE